jgi:hypothetical protein
MLQLTGHCVRFYCSAKNNESEVINMCEQENMPVVTDDEATNAEATEDTEVTEDDAEESAE